MKIAVYGTGDVGERVWRVSQKRKCPPVEIVYFVRTVKNRNSFHGVELRAVQDISYADFDYLVIASDLYADEMAAQLEAAKNGYEQYRDKVVKHLELFPGLREDDDEKLPYKSYKVSGDLVFLARADDIVIPRAMYYSEKVYSETNIDAFFTLTEKYYGYGASSFKGPAYFLDIGANIGTTSIYVEKKISQSLKVIGFEPGQSNSDLFRANCVLNHTKNVKAECFGLSDRNETKKYHYVNTNSGASSVAGMDESEAGSETVKLRSLDDYLADCHIAPDEIKYIWMDAEGYESKIIAGAMKTLSSSKIPLLQEFSPSFYAGQNMLEAYFENMQKIYGHFISLVEKCAQIETVHPISKLPDYAGNMPGTQEDLFFF